MDVATFCKRANVVIVAGKGGVGKTTITAALGVTAARAGLDVLLVGLDDQRGLPDLFGLDSSLSYEDTDLGSSDLLRGEAGRGRGRLITSDLTAPFPTRTLILEAAISFGAKQEGSAVASSRPKRRCWTTSAAMDS